MTRVLFTALLLWSPLIVAEEHDLEGKVSALGFLVGSWVGQGEHHHVDGRVNQFQQTIETHFSDNPRTIFEAKIVYTYDVDPGEH